MVLISNKGWDIDETWWDVCSFCFVYSYKIHNRVLITKTALTKLLESTLDESLELKNISDKRLGCLTKSLLSQNFYRTMSHFSKTVILHPVTYMWNSGTLLHRKCHFWNSTSQILEKFCNRNIFSLFLTKHL